MAKLTCDVNSCIYNFGLSCSKSKIRIADLDTACMSFHKTKKDIFEKQKYDSEIGSMEGNTNQFVSIECDELKCKYNRDKLCASANVAIRQFESNRLSEGKCETFTIDE